MDDLRYSDDLSYSEIVEVRTQAKKNKEYILKITAQIQREFKGSEVEVEGSMFWFTFKVRGHTIMRLRWTDERVVGGICRPLARWNEKGYK